MTRWLAAAGGATRAVATWSLETLAALVPERCAGCERPMAALAGTAVDEPRGVCDACAAEVVRFERPFCLDDRCAGAARCWRRGHLRVTAAAQYGDSIAALVRAAKFHAAPRRLSAWARVWRDSRDRATARERCDLLVPVPAHAARVRERGFDVTAAWAARLSRLEGVPVVRALRRPRSTPPQVGLDRERRAANVRGAFAPGIEAACVRGRRVAVVDDVLTTGATARAAAEALRALRAREVCAWVFAYEPLE